MNWPIRQNWLIRWYDMLCPIGQFGELEANSVLQPHQERSDWWVEWTMESHGYKFGQGSVAFELTPFENYFLLCEAYFDSHRRATKWKISFVWLD
jgi:hypothetical protein